MCKPALEDINYSFQQLFDIGNTNGYNFARQYLNFQGRDINNYSKFSGNYKGLQIMAICDDKQRTIAVSISECSYDQFNNIANIVASRFGAGQYANLLRTKGHEEYYWQLSPRYLVEVYGYPNQNKTDLWLNGNFFINMW